MAFGREVNSRAGITSNFAGCDAIPDAVPAFSDSLAGACITCACTFNVFTSRHNMGVMGDCDTGPNKLLIPQVASGSSSTATMTPAELIGGASSTAPAHRLWSRALQCAAGFWPGPNTKWSDTTAKGLDCLHYKPPCLFNYTKPYLDATDGKHTALQAVLPLQALRRTGAAPSEQADSTGWKL